MAANVEKALEEVYASLHNDNENIDTHILTLKTALQAQGEAAVTMNPARLPQPNRQGRKLLQSYFKKSGVIVNFQEAKA